VPDTEDSPPSSAKVRNEWSYNFTPLTFLHALNKDNFSFGRWRSVVGIKTRPLNGLFGVLISQKKKFFPFPASSSISTVVWSYSSLTSADVKDDWNYNSTPLYLIMALTGTALHFTSLSTTSWRYVEVKLQRCSFLLQVELDGLFHDKTNLFQGKVLMVSTEIIQYQYNFLSLSKTWIEVGLLFCLVLSDFRKSLFFFFFWKVIILAC